MTFFRKYSFSEKIVALVALFLIVSVIIFLLFSIRSSDKVILYGVVALIFLPVGFICFQFIVISFILKVRIKSFAKISKEYKILHNHVTGPNIFIPYGVLNSLSGKINNHSVEISDVCVEPKVKEMLDSSLQSVAVTTLISAGKFSHFGSKKSQIYTQFILDGKVISTSGSKWGNPLTISPFYSIKKVSYFLNQF